MPNNPFKNFFKRSEDEIIQNAPLVLEVGGHNPERPDRKKKLEIREPSDLVFQTHVGIIATAAQDVAEKEKDWVVSILSKSADRLYFADLLRFKPFKEAADKLVAEIVGEDLEFTRADMSFREKILVLAAYAKVVGFEELRSLFIAALEHWRTVSRVWKADGSGSERQGSKSPDIPDGLSSILARSGVGNSEQFTKASEKSPTESSGESRSPRE